MIIVSFQFFRRSITGLLNKLTPENFPTLAEKMKTLPIDTSTRMQQVVEMIHQKVSNHFFSVV